MSILCWKTYIKLQTKQNDKAAEAFPISSWYIILNQHKKNVFKVKQTINVWLPITSTEYLVYDMHT